MYFTTDPLKFFSGYVLTCALFSPRTTKLAEACVTLIFQCMIAQVLVFMCLVYRNAVLRTVTKTNIMTCESISFIVYNLGKIYVLKVSKQYEIMTSVKVLYAYP